MVGDYSLRRDIGQAKRIIVMTEASGMAPMVAQTAHQYGVDVLSAGGFNGVTGKHDLAVDIFRTWAMHDRRTVVLHVGDFDPSGVHVFSNLSEDVRAFVDDMSIGADIVQFERIAVTEHQIAALGLPTAPAKTTDARSFDGIDGDGTSTVQAEAIDPAMLAQIVEDAILAYWDESAAKALLEREAEEKARLERWLERAGDPETSP